LTHRDSNSTEKLDLRIGRITELTASTSHLISPHGGELIQLQVPEEVAAELKGHSKEWPSWDLTARQLCDLELLMSGGFSPLSGFMNRADYEGVCHNMRLANGVLWPIPITLDVTEEFAKKLTPGKSKIALRDAEGVMLAVLTVGDARKRRKLYSIRQAARTRAPTTPSTSRTPGTWAAAFRESSRHRITISARYA